jgi:hypothetical protein
MKKLIIIIMMLASPLVHSGNIYRGSVDHEIKYLARCSEFSNEFRAILIDPNNDIKRPLSGIGLRVTNLNTNYPTTDYNIRADNLVEIVYPNISHLEIFEIVVKNVKYSPQRYKLKLWCSKDWVDDSNIWSSPIDSK